MTPSVTVHALEPVHRNRTSPPILPVATRYVDGRLQIGTIPFVPNTTIKRCGKVYVVDASGTQRRVKP